MNTKELMLALLRAGLRGEAVSAETLAAAQSADAQRELFALAKRFDLAHVVGERLSAAGLLTDGEEPGRGRAADFKTEQMMAVMRYRRLEHELCSVCELFEREGIPHIPLKGSVIRKFYPKPWMRTSCDVDILVKPEDTERAASLLVSELGYDRGGTGSHDVSLFAESGIHVELHYSMIEEGVLSASYKLLSEVWEHASLAEGSVYRYELSDEVFYFYHISHMAKHFLNGGCGIRPFMDIWILRHAVEYDGEKRARLIREGKLEAFTAAAQQLSECWFGNGAHNGLTEEMENFLMSGGTYGGFENSIAVSQVREGGKLKYAVSKIFLPYDIIKFHYPRLQKHRWLTPIYQVRRWFKLLFCGGVKRSVKTLKKNSSITADDAERTKKLLTELGIEEK